MTSIKERMAKLNQSAGGQGIPLPQVAGSGGMMRMHRQGSSKMEADEVLDRAKSEADLMSGNGVPADASMLSVQSERSLLSEGEKFDTLGSLPSESHDDFNAAQMSKPLMAARRRPSQVQNFASMIPAETRISMRDLMAVDGTAGAAKPSVFANPPSGLSSAEQWLVDRLVQMERDYQSRITILEQETAILREALVAAKIPVPPRPSAATVAPPSSSTTSTPNTVSEKKVAVAAAPMSPSRKPPMPSSPGALGRRMSSTDSSVSERSSLRRDQSGDVAAALEKASSPGVPPKKIAAVIGGSRPVPEAPKEEEPSTQGASLEIQPASSGLETSMETDKSMASGAETLGDQSKTSDSASATNPFEDSGLSASEPEPKKAAAEEDSKASAKHDDEEDVDDDLKDML